MLCRNPFIRDKTGKALHPAVDSEKLDGTPFPCGQCLPCRINRRRVWTHRIMLESYLHKENCFITLTYAPDYLPSGGNLVPRDTQLFLKRLRKMVSPRKIRYFIVGEYGDKTCRPHYHAIIFNLSYDEESLIQKAWPFGLIHCGDVTFDSAAYVCGYVVKGMTRKTDSRLNGLEPEFCRMSRKPGIGYGVIDEIKKSYNKYPQISPFNEDGDVINSLNHGRRSMPLGRYLIGKLRETFGVSDVTRETILNNFIVEQQRLYLDFEKETTPEMFGDYLERQNLQRHRQLDFKENLKRQRRTL